jgi:urease accessory protein
VDPHGSPARVGRDGTLSLRLERRGAATVLAGCRFTLPLQVLAPLALDEQALVVSMLNPTGAVLGGDHLAIDVHASAGAHGLLTTPSATKVYRSDGPVAVQDVRLVVAPGAVVEWVPDHTIPFAGAAYRQRLHARVGADATLVVLDAFAAGRVARGERWRFRLLESALSITDEDGWLLHDRFVLRGDGPWDELGFTEGRPYFATMAVVAPTPVETLARAVSDAVGARGFGGPSRQGRACVSRGPHVHGGARIGVGRLPRRGILVRCLADTAPALGDAIRASWDAVRAVAIGAPPADLRKY